ncbi:MAG: hypothetical protein PHC68_16110 [Syntrophorhabdaceae bacterium]|nr:hypothetical protein [Syntrophorhabdaceae bacterium]
MNEVKRGRGRPRSENKLVNYQLRLEPELIQQLRVRIGRGKISTFVRDAVVKELGVTK